MSIAKRTTHTVLTRWLEGLAPEVRAKLSSHDVNALYSGVASLVEDAQGDASCEPGEVGGHG